MFAVFTGFFLNYGISETLRSHRGSPRVADTPSHVLTQVKGADVQGVDGESNIATNCHPAR
jgi:hypothetical protein